MENENGTTTKCACVMVKGLVRGTGTGKAVATVYFRVIEDAAKPYQNRCSTNERD